MYAYKCTFVCIYACMGLVLRTVFRRYLQQLADARTEQPVPPFAGGRPMQPEIT